MLVMVNRSGVTLDVPEATYNTKKHLFTPVSPAKEEGELSDRAIGETSKAVVQPKKKGNK